jgi:hypothetical protein
LYPPSSTLSTRPPAVVLAILTSCRVTHA